MTIIEYNQSHPHPSGFIGLRVFVKKIGAPPYQEYFNFRGMNRNQIKELRELAQIMDDLETQDQQQRKISHLINKGSRCPLSFVFGISAGLTARHKPNDGGFRYEFYLAVTSAGADVIADKSGSVRRITRSLSRFDYVWFVRAWKAVCRIRAELLGLPRVPTQWLIGVADEKTVSRYIEKRKKKAIKMAIKNRIEK